MKEKIIIVDIDDVLNNFKEEFSNYLESKYSIFLDKNKVFPSKLNFFIEEFIEDGGFYSLRSIEDMVELINNLFRKYYIYIVTARYYNVDCVYQTLLWLNKIGIKYNNIEFNRNKCRFLLKNNINPYFCIEDSTRHIKDYLKNNWRVFSPEKNYNIGINGVKYYNSTLELEKLIMEYENRNNE